MDINTIMESIIAIFVFAFICTPIALLSILIARTNKPKNPQQHIKLEQLEQNDYQIADDVNKAFTDFASDLESISKRLEEIEEKLDRDDSTIKGFHTKR